MLNLFKAFGTAGIVLFVVGLIAFAIFFPFLVIWALNTLFSLTIAYTIETWSAVVLLQMFFKNVIEIKGK
jgi:hypothetical protein